MFDLDKKAQSEVIDELLSFLDKRGKGKLEKMFADPEEVLGKGKGKINVSEKTFVIPFGKKKDEDEDNKESLSDDVAHFEDIYKDNFDNVDNDDPYDEKFQNDKKEYEKEEDEEDDELSLKEKKLLKLLNKI